MLVSVAEFRHFMGGVSMTESQKVSAAQILSGRQEELEDYVNRPVEPVLVRQTLYSDERGDLVLAATPVQQVLSAETVSTLYANTQLPLYMPPVLSRPTEVDQTMRIVDKIGNPFSNWRIVPGGLSVGVAGVPFLITYIGGYVGHVTNSIKLSIMTVARREYLRKFDAGIGAQGGTPDATNEADSRPDGWTLEELVAFDRIRRRTVL